MQDTCYFKTSLWICGLYVTSSWRRVSLIIQSHISHWSNKIARSCVCMLSLSVYVCVCVLSLSLYVCLCVVSIAVRVCVLSLSLYVCVLSLSVYVCCIYRVCVCVCCLNSVCMSSSYNSILVSEISIFPEVHRIENMLNLMRVTYFVTYVNTRGAICLEWRPYV